MNKNTTIQIISLLIILILTSCSNEQKAKEEPYFEGEITLSESRGLYGSLFKVHTTYTISENCLKREQKLGGLNSLANTYAGIIIDLKKDSIVLYYSDGLRGVNNKHTISVQEYKTNPKYKEISSSPPSPIDGTFKLLPKYELSKQVKDSTNIEGFVSDYSLYKDEIPIFKQEIYDTKSLKIKRELLELAFQDIPKEINFVLQSDLRTMITDISNDSIVAGRQTKALDILLRDAFNKSNEKTNLEKLAQNKWVKLGLNLIKTGVDLNIHISSEVTSKVIKNIPSSSFSLPSVDFEEISDLDDFLDDLPNKHGGDFDD